MPTLFFNAKPTFFTNGTSYSNKSASFARMLCNTLHAITLSDYTQLIYVLGSYVTRTVFTNNGYMLSTSSKITQRYKVSVYL